MVTFAIFGGNRFDGSMVHPGERVVAVSLFGGIDMDFASTPPPPATDVVVVAIFGGTTVRVRPAQMVRLSGFSLFGGRDLKPRRQIASPPGAAAEEIDDDLPIEIAAYAIFGGISIKRDDRPLT